MAFAFRESKSGRVVRILGQVGLLNERTNKPVAMIIDELDGISRRASYALHQLMLSSTVTWGGITFLCPVAVLGTTNSAARVPPAMRSRFAERIFVGLMEERDLAEVARREAKVRGLDLPEAVAVFVAHNSGGEPRKTSHLIRGLHNLIRGRTVADATMGDAERALILSGLACGGLDWMQVVYLKRLRASVGHTAGLPTIAAALSTDSREVSGAVEPSLLQMGFVDITRTGRRLTEKGQTYLRGWH